MVRLVALLTRPFLVTQFALSTSTSGTLTV